MPRDNSGIYSLPPGYLAITGETIQASQHNPPLEDLAASMSSSLPRNGAAPMTGPLKAADGTASAPGIAFNSSLNTGLAKTTNGFAVVINGVQVAEFGAGGIISGATPIGGGIDFWGDTAPAGWLFPYGQAISRTTYAALFAIIGTKYGAGDGSTTFNLPDKRDRASFGKGDMGGTAANRLQVTTTISTTDNSTSATVASAIGLAVGMFINSANIPSGTTIASFSGTTITMSAEATDTASGTAVVFSGFSSGDLGATGGAATGTLLQAQLPAFKPAITITDPTHDHDMGFKQGVTAGGSGEELQPPSGAVGNYKTAKSATGITAALTNNLGSGQAFNRLPPGIVCNYIIFAGA